MELITKSVLGIFSALGGCCAVAVPLSLKSSGKSVELSGMTNRVLGIVQTGGDVERSKNVIRECEVSGVDLQAEKISFGVGNKESTNICWSVDYKTQEEFDSDISSKYGELFWKIWDKKDSIPLTIEGAGWARECQLGTQKWKLGNSSGDREYYGVCLDAISIKTGWIERQGKIAENLKFKSCNKDCWVEEVSTSDGVKTLKNKKGEWSQMEFKTRK